MYLLTVSETSNYRIGRSARNDIYIWISGVNHVDHSIATFNHHVLGLKRRFCLQLP